MDLKFARKFNVKLAADRRQTAPIDRVLWRHCLGAMFRLKFTAMRHEILRAEVRAAVFCDAGCELRVRHSAPLKTY